MKAKNRKQCPTPSARDFVTVLSDSPGLGDFAIGLVLKGAMSAGEHAL